MPDSLTQLMWSFSYQQPVLDLETSASVC